MEIVCGMAVVGGHLTRVVGHESEFEAFRADLERKIADAERTATDPATKPYRRKIAGQNARRGRTDLENILSRPPVTPTQPVLFPV